MAQPTESAACDTILTLIGQLTSILEALVAQEEV